MGDNSMMDPPKPEVKLPTSAHLMCAWPLILVAVGGAIGGGLGGAAYAVNIAIYKSTMPIPLKILLNLLAGVAAFGLWLAIAVAFHNMTQ